MASHDAQARFDIGWRHAADGLHHGDGSFGLPMPVAHNQANPNEALGDLFAGDAIAGGAGLLDGLQD